MYSFHQLPYLRYTSSPIPQLSNLEDLEVIAQLYGLKVVGIARYVFYVLVNFKVVWSFLLHRVDDRSLEAKRDLMVE